jgi:thymidylate kinase
LLERQRRGYLSLYDQIPQMFVVDATRGADEVRRTVVSMICDRDRVRAAKKERNGHKDAAAH